MDLTISLCCRIPCSSTPAPYPAVTNSPREPFPIHPSPSNHPGSSRSGDSLDFPPPSRRKELEAKMGRAGLLGQDTRIAKSVVSANEGHQGDAARPRSRSCLAGIDYVDSRQRSATVMSSAQRSRRPNTRTKPIVCSPTWRRRARSLISSGPCSTQERRAQRILPIQSRAGGTSPRTGRRVGLSYLLLVRRRGWDVAESTASYGEQACIKVRFHTNNLHRH